MRDFGEGAYSEERTRFVEGGVHHFFSICLMGAGGMSLKAQIRAARREMRWLWTEGLPREIETRFAIVDMLQKISDRVACDPAAAARWAESGTSVTLPPPRVPALPVQPLPAHELYRHADRDAPRGEAAREEKPDVVSLPSQSTPEPAPEPAPEPSPVIKPPNYDPPEHMQIRPVWWRQRGPEDYAEDWVGRCKVDYDPLAYDPLADDPLEDDE